MQATESNGVTDIEGLLGTSEAPRVGQRHKTSPSWASHSLQSSSEGNLLHCSAFIAITEANMTEPIQMPLSGTRSRSLIWHRCFQAFLIRICRFCNIQRFQRRPKWPYQPGQWNVLQQYIFQDVIHKFLGLEGSLCLARGYQ